MSDHDQEEYEVECILDKRKRKGRLQYLVKWKGWDRPQDNSWRSMKDLHCQDLIEDFEAAVEAKLKPGDAGEKKRKKKKVDVDVRGPKLKETVSLGFAENARKCIFSTTDDPELSRQEKHHNWKINCEGSFSR